MFFLNKKLLYFFLIFTTFFIFIARFSPLPAEAEGIERIESEKLFGMYTINAKTNIGYGYLFTRDQTLADNINSVSLFFPSEVEIRYFLMTFSEKGNEGMIPCRLSAVGAPALKQSVITCFQEGMFKHDGNIVKWRLAFNASKWPKQVKVEAKTKGCQASAIKPEELYFSQMKSFQDDLRDLRKLGYNIKTNSTIFAFTAGKKEASKEGLYLQNFEGDLKKFLDSESLGINFISEFGRPPIDALSFFNNFKHLKRIPGVLSDSSDEVTVWPLFILINKITENKGIARLFNFFKYSTPLVYEGEVFLDRTNVSKEAEVIFEILKRELEELPALEKKWNEIPEDPSLRKDWPFLYQPLSGPAISLEKQENIKKLFENTTDGYLAIAAVPPDAIFTPQGVFAASLNLKWERLEKISFSPLKVNGYVKRISFNVPSSLLQNTGLQDFVVDRKYGNIMKLEHLSEKEKQVLITPSRFIEKGEAKKDLSEIKLNLSPFGLPDIIGLLFHKKEAPVAFFGKGGVYGLYSNLENEMVKKKFGEHLPFIAAGISRAEELFGLKKGEIVRHVYIASAPIPNAFIDPADFSLITFFDKIFYTDGCFGFTGTHETLHSIDIFYNLTSNQSWQEHFRNIKKKAEKSEEAGLFFSALNEGQCLPVVGFGGHAEEDEMEFFASFLNTFTHPNWQDWISKQQEENKTFAQFYSDTLSESQKILNGKISPSAQIFKNIKDKRNFLSRFVEPSRPRRRD